MSLNLYLKPGDGIYVNGALVRVDRKVRLEVTDCSRVLLEALAMPSEAARSPIEKLYLRVQSMLTAPTCPSPDQHDTDYEQALEAALLARSDPVSRHMIAEADRMVREGRYYTALRRLRTLPDFTASPTPAGPHQADRTHTECHRTRT